MNRIESYELELNLIKSRRNDEKVEKKNLEQEKKKIEDKYKLLESKMRSREEELEKIRIHNENLNNEIENIRNELNSTLENYTERKNQVEVKNGINLNSFMDEQITKHNEKNKFSEMREIFKSYNSLKKKLSSKQKNFYHFKSMKYNTRDHSSGSKTSNISAKVIKNNIEKSNCELNGEVANYQPLSSRKINNFKLSKDYKYNKFLYFFIVEKFYIQ